jgi:hypothetical protein
MMPKITDKTNFSYLSPRKAAKPTLSGTLLPPKNGDSHFIINLAQGVRKGHPYGDDYHNTTRRHPNAASAVTLPRISSESVKKMALAQRKKAFWRRAEKNQKNIVKARSIKRL